MDRWSGGLKTPLHMTEVFSGETSSVGTGQITLNLRYTPKSSSHIIIPIFYENAVGEPRFTKLFSLSGKTLILIVKKYRYDKPDTPTDTANSGNAGADGHAHGISFTAADADFSAALNELQGDITVHYEVA